MLSKQILHCLRQNITYRKYVKIVVYRSFHMVSCYTSAAYKSIFHIITPFQVLIFLFQSVIRIVYYNIILAPKSQFSVLKIKIQEWAESPFYQI